jgi:cystathionine beta-lyase/cystathionine gamma-synthase
MVSFYTLPSSILGHPEHKELRAAYAYYTGEQGAVFLSTRMAAQSRAHRGNNTDVNK